MAFDLIAGQLLYQSFHAYLAFGFVKVLDHLNVKDDNTNNANKGLIEFKSSFSSNDLL
jgi:hypothetical protein